MVKRLDGETGPGIDIEGGGLEQFLVLVPFGKNLELI